MNLTNLMIRWKTAKDRPSKGGFHAMTLRLDRFNGVQWNNYTVHQLIAFCQDFQIKHELVPQIESEWWYGVHDAVKCATLLRDIRC
jgi:hypothetical protein